MIYRSCLFILLAVVLTDCRSKKKSNATGAASVSSITEQITPFDAVNPFIGTGGHGHTYPGATSPFGLVQLSPDTRLEGWDGCGGYHYDDDTLYGFSHTHL